MAYGKVKGYKNKKLTQRAQVYAEARKLKNKA
jgi:hypothetical protein